MTTQEQATESSGQPKPSREGDGSKDVLRHEMEQVEAQARELWHVAAAKMRKPSVGAAIAGAAVLAAGAVWGASEAAIAAIAAYAVFRMLRKRRGGSEADEERGERVERRERASAHGS